MICPFCKLTLNTDFIYCYSSSHSYRMFSDDSEYMSIFTQNDIFYLQSVPHSNLTRLSQRNLHIEISYIPFKSLDFSDIQKLYNKFYKLRIL